MSDTGNGCVEVAIADSGVFVRDSKDRSGPVLGFTFPEWNAFLLGVHGGEFPMFETPRSGDLSE